MQHISPSTQVYIHSRHYTKDEDAMTIQKYDTRYTMQPSIHILTGGQLGSAGGMLPWKGT